MCILNVCVNAVQNTENEQHTMHELYGSKYFISKQ